MEISETGNAAGSAYFSGLVVIALHLAYAAVTIGGFLALEHPDTPISDPWFAMMEVLIIGLGPPVLVFLAALGHVETARRPWFLAAAIMAGIAFSLSASLHIVLLVIGRGHPMAVEGALLAFTWPSVAYAIDILAWDWFFACAMLCCAMGLRDTPAMKWASRAFALSGLFAFAGLAGPLSASMTLRNIGIIGYAVLFPLAVCLALRALLRMQAPLAP